jgi:hypothetical protein
MFRYRSSDEYGMYVSQQVACTGFKQLFRRMMHLKDWAVDTGPDGRLPHNPDLNRLRYLHHFSPTKAFHMMTAPDWTRAIFVRDPRSRALSAYLDKAVNDAYFYKRCCKIKDCAQISSSFKLFMELISDGCSDPHWTPQFNRIDEPFWQNINFVGRFETLYQDARRLLEEIDAWEEFGASGWGQYGNQSMFTVDARHKTNSKSKQSRYYNESGVEKMVADYYAKDYGHPLFNFTRYVGNQSQ